LSTIQITLQRKNISVIQQMALQPQHKQLIKIPFHWFINIIHNNT